MEDGSPSSLLVILSLILVHGVLALAYGAFTNIRVNVLREEAEDGNRRSQRVIDLAHENPNFTLTYGLVTGLLKFTIAAVAVIGIAQPLIPQGQSYGLVIYAVVLTITACVTLTLGDMVPEAIGSAYPHGIAMALVGLMSLVIVLMTPLTAVLVLISKAVTSLFSSSELVNRVTEEEIVTLIESGHTGGTIEDEAKEMMLSVLQLDETRVGEVMVPRIDMVALDIDTALPQARAKFIESGFSRIPVYEGTVDTIKGLLYAKDLLAYWHNDRVDHTHDEDHKTIRDLLRPVYFVPEAKAVDDLLKELQSQRVHMAIVVDEYGGTAGLVTIENIIEEIIGDIRDEYDPEEEAEYVKTGDGEYIVEASINLDDFNELLDVELPIEDSNTLGGFIYTYFGRIPLIGEEINFEDEVLLRVKTVEGRRIRKVYVKLLTPENGEGTKTDEAPDPQLVKDEAR